MTNAEWIRLDEHFKGYSDDDIANTLLMAADGTCEICACEESCQNGEPERRCCWGNMMCWLEEEVQDDKTNLDS